jgi:PAS domain S-box-containing protein
LVRDDLRIRKDTVITSGIFSGAALNRKPDELLRTSDASGNSLKHSEFLLASIVESSDDAIISKDLNGTITSWNKAAGRMFGYRPDETIGRSILLLIPAHLHAEEAEILRKVRAGERIERYETVRVTKAGQPLEVSLSISPIRDESGRIIGSAKIAHDISGRKRDQQALSLLASIVESSDDAIVSKTLDGVINSWNAAAQHLFGYTEEEIVGQSILKLIPTELYHEEDEILRKLRAGQRIDHYETTRITKSGERIEVSVTISPIRDDAGRPIGASKIVRDIRVRKQMERSLIQAEKLAATGRMAATIAHEINNPLESVMNLVFLARKSVPSDSKVCAYLETAEKEIERVSHIARQTLGYYRDAGPPVEVLLHELIEDVLTVYQSKLRARGISVECQFEDRRKIAVSKGEFLQVFSNIIANSIDAMPRGGLLRIQIAEATKCDEVVLDVVVQDQGTGIEQELLARVFEPFFTTKGSTGTGIGLWVAKQLVEKRGGQIILTSSTRPGNSGTSINLSIPFAKVERRNDPEDKK